MASLEKILENAFLDYSAFVIQRRAIPDARDCIKFTQRQILHAQAKDKHDHKHPYKKSQKSVAAATSFSYLHGGSSAYEQIIRMGRPLVQRYFLEDINGNGGTPASNSDYAAERYTEARLSELTGQLFNYIDMGTILDNDWELTYDEEGLFPKVLPSVGYYNICNGSFGSIAPTMISSIPQFNLREVNEAICCLIDNPENDVQILPDFASGGILLNPKTTLVSLSQGEGKSALIRGKLHMKPKEGFLEVTELPYGVYTNTICLELEKAFNAGDAPFETFKDLSRDSVQIRVYAKDLTKLEQWLYKNTSVQKHFTIKMIMLDKGKTPLLFTIKKALLAHIEHARAVFRKQYETQLASLKIREEVIRGLLIAYSILDQVIATIKISKGRSDAITSLMRLYDFSQRQAEAIVDLRLHKLSSIDIEALNVELDTNLDSQADIEETLELKEKFNMQLKSIYEYVAKKYGDNRKTEICLSDAWETVQDGTKAETPFWLTLCDNSYIAVADKETGQNVFMVRIEPDDEMVIVTDQVRGFTRKGSEFMMGEVQWGDLIKLNKDEKVLFITQKETLPEFEFIELEDAQGKIWSLHHTFISAGASQRGKKLVNGKYQVKLVEFQKTDTIYPKMK